MSISSGSCMPQRFGLLLLLMGLNFPTASTFTCRCLRQSTWGEEVFCPFQPHPRTCSAGDCDVFHTDLRATEEHWPMSEGPMDLTQGWCIDSEELADVARFGS